MTERYRHSKMMDPLPHGQHKSFGKATYREIGGPNGHLAKREEFQGNSMRGEWEHHANETSHLIRAPHDAYVVYSYDQVIAIYDPVCWGPSGGVIDPRNLDGYSTTTSRHIGLCRAWLKE